MIQSPSPALTELISVSRWVCWTIIDGQKVPINPHTGKGASSTDALTWGTYEIACLYYERNQRRLQGVGFVITEDDNLIFIDLDKCLDSERKPTPFAKTILSHIASYAEVSPSGSGLHILARGYLTANLKHLADGKNIEIYCKERYMTWTGWHFEGTPLSIEVRPKEVLELYREAEKARDNSKKAPLEEVPPLSPSKYSRAARKALHEECEDIANHQEPGRNNQLNDSAYSLGQLIAGGELDRGTVENALYDAAMTCGLGHHETVNTIRSGIEAGMRIPRRIKGNWKEYVPEPPSQSNGNGNGHHQEEDNDEEEITQVAAPDLLPTFEVTDAELCKFTPDDAGNGDAMLALFGQHFLWCGSVGWFVYNTTHWQLDKEGTLPCLHAVETLRRRRIAAVNLSNETIVKTTKGDNNRVNGCLNRFKTLVSVSIDEFDTSPDHLNCKNGVVDLRTGIIEKHQRGQRFTYCTPIAYDSQADYSEWTEYLEAVVGGGEAVIDYLQMAIGYSFTGHTREEIMHYLHGPTRSGKGSIAEALMGLLPEPIAHSVDFNSFTASRDGDVSNFDLAPLKPCRILFASESNKSQSLNPAKVKQLTGGDRVTCSFKHKDFFSYRPQFKVWMMSNHPVNGDPEDDALWGRVRVIEFPNSFLGKEDKTKKAHLKEPDIQRGLLNWIVKGAIKWYALGAAGLTSPTQIVDTTSKHRSDLDFVQQWLDEVCQSDETAWTVNDTVATSYLAWCKENNVQYPKGKKGLSQSLKAKGYRIGEVKDDHGKTQRGVGGLRILTE